MNDIDWIMIGINAILVVGGAIGTLVVAILAFFIKRLIGSIDKLSGKMEIVELSLKDRPEHHWVNETAKEASNNRVVKHEADFHGSGK